MALRKGKPAYASPDIRAYNARVAKRAKAAQNAAKPPPPYHPTNLNDLPIELFVEICQYIAPLSVLYLARTSKAFHSLLTSKECTTPWVWARRSIGLPGPPRGVSEPQFASFLFERGCQNLECKVAHHTVFDFAFCVRYCLKCRMACKMTIKDIRTEWIDVPETFISCINEIMAGTSGADLWSPTIEWEYDWNPQLRRKLWRATYLDLKDRFLALPLYDEPSLSHFRAVLTAEADDRFTRGKKVQEWMQKTASSREFFPGSAYAARKSEIIKRLEKRVGRESVEVLYRSSRSLNMLDKYAKRTNQRLTNEEWRQMLDWLEQ